MSTISQNLVVDPTLKKSIKWRVTSCEVDVTEFLSQLNAKSSSSLGIAIQVLQNGWLHAIALANSNEVRVIICNRNAKKRKPAQPHSSLSEFFSATSLSLTGFHFERIAVLMKSLLGSHISGVDLTGLPIWSEKASTPGHCADKRFAQVKIFEVNALWNSTVLHDEEGNDYDDLCRRAWLTAVVSNSIAGSVNNAPVIKTSRLSPMPLRVIHEFIREVELVDGAKPHVQQGDFATISAKQGGKDQYIIHNNRFKTKVRHDEKTQMVFVKDDGTEVKGSSKGAKGKSTTVFASRTLQTSRIRALRVEGKELQTLSEKARDRFLRQLLHGEISIMRASFVRKVWFPSHAERSEMAMKISHTPITGRMNQAQADVVRAMVDSDAPIVVVHGPPGTGKTSTIATATDRWNRATPKDGTWIVAQSNVGVKNIAERLLKSEVDFKLIVSPEFYVEWHEHIYEEVRGKILQTNDIGSEHFDVRIAFASLRVVLCTLSTLSHPLLRLKGVMSKVRVNNLVVDEASQISVLEYMHLFDEFRHLKKVCFFGDPHQLPPYDKDAAPGLKCIFDIKHLQKNAYFLDIQYRMPVPIGQFISDAVYSGKLKSVHPIDNRKCLVFIDVALGQEEKGGTSWKNDREVQTIVQLVRDHYRERDFCVITPYDAQRAAIQERLKAEGLPWEQVFNVDSFQGNEAEFVLISVTRTSKPGFLQSLNRVNVMLTRCKKGMVVVSQRKFLRGAGKKTLVGKMCINWEGKYGMGPAWRSASDVMNGKAQLPGGLTR